jgi:hypothetical protein
MRSDAWAAKDSPWRHGLMQRLEDIDTELNRQVPRVLADQAERSEQPSSYQRQCQDILERLRRDCSAIDAPAGATPIEETAAGPLPQPVAAVPSVVVPIDLSARLGSISRVFPRPQETCAHPALTAAPAPVILPAGSITPLLDRIARRTTADRGEPGVASVSTLMSVAPGQATTATQTTAVAVTSDTRLQPHPDDRIGADTPITNETILEYASTSGDLADRMARRLRVGLWVVTATSGVALASVSALFVATLMDASQRTSTVHALPAGVSVASRPIKTVAVGTLGADTSGPDYSGLGSAWQTLRQGHHAGSPQSHVKLAALTPAPEAPRAAALEKAVFRADAVAGQPVQQPVASPRPRLIADLFVRREDLGSIPISLQLDGVASKEFERHAVLVRDLPDGATLSVGQRVGPRTWSLPIGAMQEARLTLPATVADSIDIRVELVDPVGDLVTRTRLRIRTMTAPKLGPSPDMVAALEAEKARLQAALVQAEKKLAVPARVDKVVEKVVVERPAPARRQTASHSDDEDSGSSSPPARKSKPPSGTASGDASSSPTRTAKLPSKPSALGAVPAKPIEPAPTKSFIGKQPEWSPFRGMNSN